LPVSGTFTVKPVSLAGNTPGVLTNFSDDGNYSWTLATVSAGITNFVHGVITVDTTGFVNTFTKQFGVTTNGNSLVLVYPYTAPLVSPVLNGTGMSFTGTGFNFSFSGLNGQTYKILASTNLTLPLADWWILTTGMFGNTPINYTDGSVTNSQRFYRIISP
jgi:hypothetical protein